MFGFGFGCVPSNVQNKRILFIYSFICSGLGFSDPCIWGNLFFNVCTYMCVFDSETSFSSYRSNLIWNLPFLFFSFPFFALFFVIVSMVSRWDLSGLQELRLFMSNMPCEKGPIPSPLPSLLQFLSSALRAYTRPFWFSPFHYLFLVDLYWFKLLPGIRLGFLNMCFHSWFCRHHRQQFLCYFERYVNWLFVNCHGPPFFSKFV